MYYKKEDCFFGLITKYVHRWPILLKNWKNLQNCVILCKAFILQLFLLSPRLKNIYVNTICSTRKIHSKWPPQRADTLDYYHRYSTVQLKLVVTTKLPFLSLTFSPPVSYKFPRWEFLWNSSHSFFPFFTDVGEIDLGNTISLFSPNFPQISPEFPTEFPPNSPDFSIISPDSPRFPQFPVQFSIQLHNCTLSLSIRPILCISHVSLKMRIPHYARQRILNLGNSGEIQGNSGNFREFMGI